MFKSMKKKICDKFLYPALFFVVAAVVALSPLGKSISYAAQTLYNKWMILSMVIEKIERFYVTQPNTDDLFDNAIRGILDGLDPHSVYLTREQYQDWKKQYEGYLGIGVKYQKVNGDVVIVSVMRESPAEKAGLKIGDVIVKVEGLEVGKLKHNQIKDLLFGPPKSFVTLVRKDAKTGELQEMRLERAYVQPSSIPCSVLLPDSVGYIKIAHFTQSTPTELDVEFAELRSAGMTRLILDLRDNSGGDFYAGIQVADRFVPAGKMILFTKGRAGGTTEQYIATGKTTLPSLPLVVLVNQATASDAEIVAAAIQDWKIGLIVGQPTFGKGLIQTEFPLQDGSALLLSTAQYFSPSGRALQKVSGKTSPGIVAGEGVLPDVKMAFQGPQLPDAVKNLYDRENNPFFRFAAEFTRTDSVQYDSVNDFVREFAVDDSMLNSFFQLLSQWGLPGAPTDKRSHKEVFEFLIKREIAGRLYGNEAKYAIDVAYDPDIKRIIKIVQARL